MTRKVALIRSQLQLPSLSAELRAVVNADWTFRPNSVSEAVRNEAARICDALAVRGSGRLDGGLQPCSRDFLGDELRRLFTVFWDRRPEQHWQALMESYAQVVGHFPEAVIAAGVDECIKTATFLPKPADLLAACRSAMPEDYRKAYILKGRLEAISRAPVAVANAPLSDAEKQQISDVIQRLAHKKPLPAGGEQC